MYLARRVRLQEIHIYYTLYSCRKQDPEVFFSSLLFFSFLFFIVGNTENCFITQSPKKKKILQSKKIKIKIKDWLLRLPMHERTLSRRKNSSLFPKCKFKRIRHRKLKHGSIVSGI